jgi:phenylacetic acid degradation operon negative regulatory protein
VHARHLPAIRPLTARSVALSTLLGYHPPELPVSALVRVGRLFGITERATRVALTRMVADADLTACDGTYRLADRLRQRQIRQEESCSPQSKDWDGSWDMAVVTARARPLPERVTLRRSMLGYRLAELREGVWIRPGNLIQQPDAAIAEQCVVFCSRPSDSLELARSLWDLAGWAAEAHRLGAALGRADTLIAGFMITAEVLRHLLIDPCLPAELLPDNWPGAELRQHYAHFNRAYAQRLRDYYQG